jgi:hypothetical protein
MGEFVGPVGIRVKCLTPEHATDTYRNRHSNVQEPKKETKDTETMAAGVYPRHTGYCIPGGEGQNQRIWELISHEPSSHRSRATSARLKELGNENMGCAALRTGGCTKGKYNPS